MSHPDKPYRSEEISPAVYQEGDLLLAILTIASSSGENLKNGPILSTTKETWQGGLLSTILPIALWAIVKLKAVIVAQIKSLPATTLVYSSKLFLFRAWPHWQCEVLKSRHLKWCVTLVIVAATSCEIWFTPPYIAPLNTSACSVCHNLKSTKTQIKIIFPLCTLQWLHSLIYFRVKVDSSKLRNSEFIQAHSEVQV